VFDLTEKLTAFLQKAVWPMVILVIVALAGGVAYSFKSGKDQEALQKAQDELFVIRKEVEETAKKMEPPVDPKADPKKPAAKVEKPPAELEKAYGPAVEKLQAYIKANQGKQGAVEAALLASELTSDYKKYEQGAEALNTALNGFDTKNFLYGVAGSEQGDLLAQIDKCNEAVQVWEKVIGANEHGYMSNTLRLKSGVCYEKLGMFDKAESHYQIIVDKDPNSSAARSAKKFLMHIKYVKGKQPQATATADEKKG